MSQIVVYHLRGDAFYVIFLYMAYRVAYDALHNQPVFSLRTLTEMWRCAVGTTWYYTVSFRKTNTIFDLYLLKKGWFIPTIFLRQWQEILIRRAVSGQKIAEPMSKNYHFLVTLSHSHSTPFFFFGLINI